MKRTTRKLGLSKESVRKLSTGPLSANQMRQVAGGYTNHANTQCCSASADSCPTVCGPTSVGDTCSYGSVCESICVECTTQVGTTCG